MKNQNLTAALTAALESLTAALTGKGTMSLTEWMIAKGITEKEMKALPAVALTMMESAYKAEMESAATATAAKIPEGYKPFSRLYGALTAALESIATNGDPAAAPEVYRLIVRNYKANSGKGDKATE